MRGVSLLRLTDCATLGLGSFVRLQDCVLWQVEDEEGRPLMAFIPDALIPASSDSSDSDGSSCRSAGSGEEKGAAKGA